MKKLKSLIGLSLAATLPLTAGLMGTNHVNLNKNQNVADSPNINSNYYWGYTWHKDASGMPLIKWYHFWISTESLTSIKKTFSTSSSKDYYTVIRTWMIKNFPKWWSNYKEQAINPKTLIAAFKAVQSSFLDVDRWIGAGIDFTLAINYGPGAWYATAQIINIKSQWNSSFNGHFPGYGPYGAIGNQDHVKIQSNADDSREIAIDVSTTSVEWINIHYIGAKKDAPSYAIYDFLTDAYPSGLFTSWLHDIKVDGGVAQLDQIFNSLVQWIGKNSSNPNLLAIKSGYLFMDISDYLAWGAGPNRVF